MTTGSGLFSNKGAVQPRFIEGKGGVAGEVADLRQDVKSVLSPLAALTVEEFTNPAAGGAALLQAATATVAAPVTVAHSQLLAGGLAVLAQYPRTLIFTTGGTTPADAPATVTVTGKDINGAAQSETLNLAQTAAAVETVKAYVDDDLTVSYPSADGTGATVAIGIGAKLGLGKKLKTRAGAVSIIKEHAAGTVVTNGVLTTAETSAPNGLYAPNAAPNGTNDYSLMYEFDPAS